RRVLFRSPLIIRHFRIVAAEPLGGPCRKSRQKPPFPDKAPRAKRRLCRFQPSRAALVALVHQTSSSSIASSEGFRIPSISVRGAFWPPLQTLKKSLPPMWTALRSGTICTSTITLRRCSSERAPPIEPRSEEHTSEPSHV